MSDWLSWSNLFYLLGLMLAAGLTMVATKYTSIVKELKDVAKKLEEGYADGELSKSEKEAVTFTNCMLHKGVILRHLAGWGLPDCVRVTIGTDWENDYFINCLSEIICETI